MARRKKTATVNFTLRLREDLRRRLEAAAKKEERSLNEEIVRRLEESFQMANANEVLARAIGILKLARNPYASLTGTSLTGISNLENGTHVILGGSDYADG